MKEISWKRTLWTAVFHFPEAYVQCTVDLLAWSVFVCASPIDFNTECHHTLAPKWDSVTLRHYDPFFIWGSLLIPAAVTVVFKSGLQYVATAVCGVSKNRLTVHGNKPFECTLKSGCQYTVSVTWYVFMTLLFVTCTFKYMLSGWLPWKKKKGSSYLLSKLLAPQWGLVRGKMHDRLLRKQQSMGASKAISAAQWVTASLR